MTILWRIGKVVGVRTATHQEYRAKLLLSLLGQPLYAEKLSLEILGIRQGPNYSLASINFT